MSMRKPIALTWDGEKHELVVTMAIIDRLEDHVNLALLVGRCQQGDVRISHCAKLLWRLLVEAGVEDYDDFYDDVYASLHGTNIKELSKLLKEIFGVIFPAPRKKSDTTGKTKSSTRTKSTRGKRSTK